MKKLGELLDILYCEFHVVGGTSVVQDEMHFNVVVGCKRVGIIVYRKGRRIVVEADPGWYGDEERRMVKRHLRDCTKGWKIC